MPAMLQQRCTLRCSRSEAVTGHEPNPISHDRHFLKGGRWRSLLAATRRIRTPSFR
jgi:hypothetical protein